jgi:hypothetical protein
MSAGLSTFIAVALWALPIVIALLFMVAYYRPPSMEEIRKADEVARKQ